MTATTEELRRNLHSIRHALVGLRYPGVAEDPILMDEIRRLETTSKAIQGLLETRRSLRRQPVISLLAWREGSLAAPPLGHRRAATLADYLQGPAQERH